MEPNITDNLNPEEIETIIGKEFATKVIPLIKNAKRKIDIVVYNWYWYPDQPACDIQKFNTAIVQAAHKNVQVRVLTNAIRPCNILVQNRVLAKQWLHRKNLHTKLMIIDNSIAIIGSHNYTMSAFTRNLELSVIISGVKIMKKMDAYFDSLWQS